MQTHYGDAVRGADASSDTGRLVRRNFTCLPHPQRAVFSFLKTDVKRGTEGTVKKKIVAISLKFLFLPTDRFKTPLVSHD